MILLPHLDEKVKKGEISETDAGIIVFLVDIFDKTYYYELRDILKEYKGKYSDEEILFLLQEWLRNGSVPSKVLIKLGDRELNAQFIQTITLIDSYDTDKKCPLYKILINQDESDKLLMSNMEILFYSKNKRKKELDIFKEKTKYLKIKYI